LILPADWCPPKNQSFEAGGSEGATAGALRDGLGCTAWVDSRERRSLLPPPIQAEAHALVVEASMCFRPGSRENLYVGVGQRGSVLTLSAGTWSRAMVRWRHVSWLPEPKLAKFQESIGGPPWKNGESNS